MYCQNEVKILLKNTSVPKKNHFWKRLLYLKENTFERKKEGGNEVKTLLKRTSVPKRKQFKIKYKNFWKKLLYLKENAFEKMNSVLSKWSKMTF